MFASYKGIVSKCRRPPMQRSDTYSQEWQRMSHLTTGSTVADTLLQCDVYISISWKEASGYQTYSTRRDQLEVQG